MPISRRHPISVMFRLNIIEKIMITSIVASFKSMGAVCPGDCDRSGHAVCHGADGIDDGCTKGPARGYGSEFPVPGIL